MSLSVNGDEGHKEGAQISKKSTNMSSRVNGDEGHKEGAQISQKSSAVSLSVNGDGDQEEGTRIKKTQISPRYILTLDIGTTILRSHIYDQHCNIKGTSSKKVQCIHPQPGWSEIDAEELFKEVIQCMKESLSVSGLSASQVTCMGLTTQRNTFVTWNRETGKPYHNFISWQDLRAKDYVKVWNGSFTMKMFNGGSKLLHFLTRRKRFLAASVLKFLSPQVSMRFLWALHNIEGVREAANEGLLMFGCIETWLVWKLTKGAVYATDYSCASSTGLYDPFQMEWSSTVCNLLNIPISVLPEIRDTSGNFGECDPGLFGYPIPITAVVADQQSAMFGECCFEIGDVKCTMGTGTFIDLNTGRKPHASIAGLYPLIGWKIGKEVVFLAEGIASDTGNAIEWAKNIGLFEDVRDTSDLASSVEDNGGVYFVQAFSGLQAPINDDNAVTSLIGVNPKTTKAHIVRAILESVAFRFKLLYETLLQETSIPLSFIRSEKSKRTGKATPKSLLKIPPSKLKLNQTCIRADGGVCSNDFLMQLVSDLIGQRVDRARQVDVTSMGAAFLAGLATGIWQSKDELKAIRKSLSDRHFDPQEETWQKYKNVVINWERAVSRSLQWYKKY